MILYDLEQQFDVYIIWTFFYFFDIISNNKDIHYDCVSASNAFGYPNAATCSALVRAVSPAGSVSASAFGRGVRRTPAPLKPFERRNSWIIKI